MRATKTLIRLGGCLGPSARNELLFFVRSFRLDIKNIHYSTDNLRDYESVYDMLKCCNNYASCSSSMRQSCALYTIMSMALGPYQTEDFCAFSCLVCACGNENTWLFYYKIYFRSCVFLNEVRFLPTTYAGFEFAFWF